MIDALPPISPDHCIYRAPQCVRQLNEEAYTPQRVSIGPLHHGKKKLLGMEEQKLRYLKAFVSRTELNLEHFVSFVTGLEQRVRDCYSESIDLYSPSFVPMILIDSCFVIEVIFRFNIFMEQNETDYGLQIPDYLSKSISLVDAKSISLVDVVRRDMILLENQIPYFVIAGLLNLAFPRRPKTHEASFIQLSIHYFRSVLLFNHIPQTISESEVKHFVDLLRLCCLPSTPIRFPENRVKFVTIPTARDLQEFGVIIRKGSTNNVFDIQYANGVLKIPHVGIQHDSEIILRNLIAFEMCHCLNDSYIIDYVVFMDSLMEIEPPNRKNSVLSYSFVSAKFTPQNVDILVQGEIFENLLLDRASVATLFHNLTSGVFWSSGNYYYGGLCQKVNKHCKVPWNKWNAILKRDYFSTPWRIIAIVAAVILLVLTLIQTVCSVISILH